MTAGVRRSRVARLTAPRRSTSPPTPSRASPRGDEDEGYQQGLIGHDVLLQHMPLVAGRPATVRFVTAVNRWCVFVCRWCRRPDWHRRLAPRRAQNGKAPAATSPPDADVEWRREGNRNAKSECVGRSDGSGGPGHDGGCTAPPRRRRADPQRPVPSIEDRTTGLRKIDGYFPLYWDERAGVMLLEVPRVDTEFLFSTGLSAGLGSNDLGLDRGQGGQGRIVDVPARRSASAAGAAEPVVSLEQQQPARAPFGRGLVRQVGAVGLRGGGRVERPTAGRCHRLLPARRAWRRRRPAARHLPRRQEPQRLLPAEHQGLSEEHRSGHDADLRQRGRQPARRPRAHAGPGADRRDRRRAAAAASAATSSAAPSAASRRRPMR